MNELQRRAYLQAMQIEGYCPRLALPGAMPSKLLEVPIASTGFDAQPIHAEASGRQAAVGSEQTQALFDQQVDAKPAARAASEDGPAKSRAASETPHFGLSIVRGDQLLIIDDALPGDTNPRDYLQLVQNMVFAVGIDLQAPSVDSFIWPMTQNSQVDQSEVAAKEVLRAFINKQVEQSAAHYLLLMGERANYFLNHVDASLGDLHQDEELKVAVLGTNSLVALLKTPLQKAALWHQLQALRNSLLANQPKALAST